MFCTENIFEKGIFFTLVCLPTNGAKHENMFICAIKAENEFYLSFVGIDHEYLSWQETQEYANILNMKILPVIYEVIYKEKISKKGACFVRIKKAFSRYSCSKSVFQL